ncbi:MAG: YccF domain-containing protein [Spirochaetes bacterium]|nr:YccF domain-containing protein [Spirochaetota bacterium]
MSLIGNILWIFLGGGIILFFEYIIAGALSFITIIGIPFAFQFFKLAEFSLLPFGRKIRSSGFPPGCLALILNIIWIFTGGLVISVTHLFFAVLCAVTVIGIPFAVQHLKLAGFALFPFGSTAE